MFFVLLMSHHLSCAHMALLAACPRSHHVRPEQEGGSPALRAGKQYCTQLTTCAPLWKAIVRFPLENTNLGTRISASLLTSAATSLSALTASRPTCRARESNINVCNMPSTLTTHQQATTLPFDVLAPGSHACSLNST